MEIRGILLLLVMFWNLENFFDPFAESNQNGFNDRKTLTDGGSEYTPNGAKHWTWRKFKQKRDGIAKTIIATRTENGVFPALIGVCEVENRFVLNQLIYQTPLNSLGYRVLHKDSPDRRGIDVALLYRPEEFRLLRVRFLPDSNILSTTELEEYHTREILYAKGVIRSIDTIHVFVNHWPSKVGGKKSQESRMIVSNVLKRITDSLIQSDTLVNIIIMGDFNDTPHSPAVRNISNGIENLMLNPDIFKEQEGLSAGVKGTYKYRGRWEVIDQFMVSPALFMQGRETTEGEALVEIGADTCHPNLHKSFAMPHGDSIQGVGEEIDSIKENKTGQYQQRIFCTKESASVFAPYFLLEEDKTYLGNKVKRTLKGPRFNGGFSDHLPILLKVFL